MEFNEVDFAVICDQNQARSIVATAMLRKLFPRISFVSAGISALDGLPVNPKTLELCHKWGLFKCDKYSLSLESLKRQYKVKNILAADKNVFNIIKSEVTNSEITQISDYLTDSRLIPIDPINLTVEKFELEIAKFCLAAMRWYRKKSNLELKNSFFKCPTVEGFQIYEKNLAPASTIYLDLNTEFPAKEFWKNYHFDLDFFNPRSLGLLTESLSSTTSNKVLISRYEFDLVENFLLGSNIMQLIEKLNQHYKIYLTFTDEKQKEIWPSKAKHVLAGLHSHSEARD